MTIDTADLQRQLATTWLVVLDAVIVVIVAMVGHRLALNWTSSAMRRARVDTSTQILVKRAISAAFFTVTLLVVLGMLGFNSTGLLTLAGAVGLAFSLAIQDILKNFFSGIYLLLERPFRVGDTIRVKDQQGVVENIGVRTTELRTAENVQVLVPNTVVFAEVVTNHTHALAAPAQTEVTDGHPTVDEAEAAQLGASREDAAASPGGATHSRGTA
ncbi:MAG: mechanosensitive ion channel family protein [Chloroflexi bacterium]|nr:mechanosensitive ion channel family protein [Chloroflexota bacterium]